MKEKDLCFVSQPKADNQGSKILFCDFKWVGPYNVQKAFPNDNDVVRKVNTDKTQSLHRIRLKKCTPNKPITETYQKEKLQPEDDIIIPQDDLYTLTWETDFGNQISENFDTVSPTVSDQLQRYETETAAEPTVTRTRIENELNNPNTNDVNDKSKQRDQTNTNDAMHRVSDLSRQRQNDEAIPNTDGNDTQENVDLENNFPTGRAITVPGISENDEREKANGNSSPRGGNNGLRPSPPPTILMNTDNK